MLTRLCHSTTAATVSGVLGMVGSSGQQSNFPIHAENRLSIDLLPLGKFLFHHKPKLLHQTAGIA
jgi:hypothetical protein